MFDVIGRRRWFYAFSLLITVPGLIFILLTPLTGGAAGLKFSIDYTGGTQWEIRFQDPSVTAAQIKAVLAQQGLGDSTVTATKDGFFDIRTKPIGLPPVAPKATPSPSASASGSPGASASPGAGLSASPAASPSAATSPSPAASPSAAASASPAASPSGAASPSPSPLLTGSGSTLPTTGKIGEVAAALQQQLGPIADQRRLTTVGPVVSADLITQALILILAGSIGILLWITVRFRDFRFGVAALVAMLHDIVVVVGVFAVLGTLFGVEIDALFVTAMLTVIGFSVHDTIVVFDRVRENRARHAGEPFDRIVNHSVLQTFGRSINTSLTVVLTLLALLLFGGSAIRFFVLALLLGIISGTYSSIFNASPILVTWHEWDTARKARAAGRPVRRPA
ncbi:MAG TPA: protein translocase subunit SecF [Candidatus Limnocylindria bacterium]|nr:protein translocase subunit SecF [Candidatus Limnocylindria bacterium]